MAGAHRSVGDTKEPGRKQEHEGKDLPSSSPLPPLLLLLLLLPEGRGRGAEPLQPQAIGSGCAGFSALLGQQHW